MSTDAPQSIDALRQTIVVTKKGHAAFPAPSSAGSTIHGPMVLDAKTRALQRKRLGPGMTPIGVT